MSEEGVLFVQSLWVGLSIAAPVGPIGLLVIQRTLRSGAAVGLATGLGAALADAAYGALGAFGVSALINLMQGARTPLALAGGALLLWLAWRTWHASTPARDAPGRANAVGWLPAFTSSVLLTLANPATILSFIAIFGVPAANRGAASPWWMVAGVLAGSALWWLLLCSAVSALRRRIDSRTQRLVTRGSALMLAGFALWQWGRLANGG